MTDREKVIRALEKCLEDGGGACDCPYEDGGGECIYELMRDALMRDTLEVLREVENDD